MMDAYSKEQLSKYRLERAKEALDEAELLAQQEHWNTAASRLYYACFYAASAYLVLKEVTASTHSGIKIAFNKALIRTSLLPSPFGHLYNKLFNLRQDADYRDYRDLSEDQIAPLMESARKLVASIELLIPYPPNHSS